MCRGCRWNNYYTSIPRSMDLGAGGEFEMLGGGNQEQQPTLGGGSEQGLFNQ